MDPAAELTQRVEKAVVFSDIDGTLVHYPSPDAHREVWADDHGSITGASRVYRGYSIYIDTVGYKHRVLQLPPSSTGLRGIIGSRTLTSLATMREDGTPLVLVVTENGGRIFLHDPSLPTAAPFIEDPQWRHVHAHITGPSDEDGLAAELRTGLLWDECRKLAAGGWVVDTAGYCTAFRVTLKGGQSGDQLRTVLAELPEQLTSSFNLGLADVYPSTSGKAAAARHLMTELGAHPEHCCLLCDDDNDLGDTPALVMTYDHAGQHVY